MKFKVFQNFSLICPGGGMVDTYVWGAYAFGCGGSSPPLGTMYKKYSVIRNRVFYWFTYVSNSPLFSMRKERIIEQNICNRQKMGIIVASLTFKICNLIPLQTSMGKDFRFSKSVKLCLHFERNNEANKQKLLGDTSPKKSIPWWTQLRIQKKRFIKYHKISDYFWGFFLDFIACPQSL